MAEQTVITVTTSLTAVRSALAEGRAVFEGLSGVSGFEAIERALNYGDIAADNLELGHARTVALRKLAASWEQQRDYHGQDAERFATDPSMAVAYRDLCTKTAVYQRCIDEIRALLDGSEQQDGGTSDER